jgi:hypothetical protein
MRNENARIQHLFVASLGRLPNKKEIGAFAGWVKATPNKLAAYQDLYWALLNSNEFIVNH